MAVHDIKILGPGCANCAALEANTRRAVAELELDATIDKVTDAAAIAGWGVMSTPGLVVDGRVVAIGRVPSPSQLVELVGGAIQGT